MTLGQCLQLAAVQEALWRGALPLGRPVRAGPCGRDPDGDPVVVLTWKVGRARLGYYACAFSEVDEGDG